MECAVRVAQALRLVGMDQTQLQPVADGLQVRRGPRRQRGLVYRRPGEYGTTCKIAPEIARHVGGALVAACRIRLHRGKSDPLQGLRDRAFNLDRKAWRLSARRHTAQQLVQDDPECVHVRTGIDRFRWILLFGRHVGRCADEMTVARIAAADPEVEEPWPQLRVHHDVRWLQVTMLDAEVVRVLQCLTQVDEELGLLPTVK